MPRHPDDVACAMSPSNEVRQVVWPLGTRLASDLGRARQKVPIRTVRRIGLRHQLYPG